MPVQYTSILEEHKAVRNTAGLFDVSHMGEFEVSGAGSAEFLDHLVVNSIATAPIGKAVYSPMCKHDGGVVDDLIIYRTDREHFLVCVNASNIQKDYNWFIEQAKPWKDTVVIQDHSNKYALLALQGPKAESILNKVGLDGLHTLKRFWHTAIDFSNEEIRVCRTGYTGEDGFEIYSSPEVAEQLAKQILNHGQEDGVLLCGLGARDSLRLEAGLPLYGHELSDTISPLEAGVGWTVKFEKDDFIGKTTLAKQKENGLTRQVIHFKLEGRRIAREGTKVVNSEGEIVGTVLSGTLSPVINCPIGSAIIDNSQLGSDLYVDLRGNQLQLQIAKAPLHKTA